MTVPYISREDVSAVLSSLIHNTNKSAADGLQHLLLIDLLVIAPDMPQSDTKRAFAVQDLLVSEITHALNQQRALFQLNPINDRASADEAEREFAELVKLGKHELLAWGILYYRYIRSDLDVSLEGLAQLMAVTPRTVSRYNDDGIELLTQRLIHLEQKARRGQNERRLFSMLPYSVPVHLIGRDALLDSTETLIVNLTPCHILITGAVGVGKTVFVQEFLRRQIIAGRLDHLIWLDQPISAQFVREQLTERFLGEEGEVTLRDYLMLYHVGVVLDGIDFLAADRTAFASLLRDLGAAVVFLINRVYIPLEGVEVHLQMPEIDLQAAGDLINYTLRMSSSANSENAQQIVHDLYKRLGGNPLALRLAAGLWESSGNWEELNVDVHDRLFSQMFVAFNEKVKFTWCALALFPQSVPLTQLTTIRDISARSIGVLTRHGLIEGDGDAGYLLVGAAREYVRRVYTTDEHMQRIFSELVGELSESDATYDIFEQVLMNGFPEITIEQRAGLIGRLWKLALRREHHANWRVIFEDYMQRVEAIEPELHIAYGVCLRCLAEWEEAQQVFYNISLECGRSGQFAEQGRAFLEWSVLAKYRGEYERAQLLIGQTKRYALRAQDEDLLQEVTFREAQILIEQRNGADASSLLTALPESLRVLVLQSEAQLILGNYAFCRILAERALKLSVEDQVTQASLYTIIGRSYQAEKEDTQAHGSLTYAVTLLERLDNVFALGRAQTNLAAALIAMKRYRDAEPLLTNAEQSQSRLGDKVGLSATRHNRAILGSYIAR